VLILGHYFQNTDASKPIKGSEDIDFRLVF